MGEDHVLVHHRHDVIVEGAGGLMSPLSDDSFVADLACEFGWGIVVVARMSRIHHGCSGKKNHPSFHRLFLQMSEFSIL